MSGESSIIERRIPVGDLFFNVVESGRGPAVVLLHGFPDSWHLWRHQIEALAAAGFRVIAPDLRGFGQSDKPTEVHEYGMIHLVGDVTGIMDALDVETAVLVGHDWGSALAWMVATFAPARVERLVAVSVGHPGAVAGAGLAQKRLSWYMLWYQFPDVAETGLAENDWYFLRESFHGGAAPGSDPDFERQIADLARPGALTAGLNWYRANIAPAGFHRSTTGFDFPLITCPTMGVWGSDDFALSERSMTGSASYVRGPWRYERLEDVDHWVPVHAAERLNVLLLDFLAE